MEQCQFKKDILNEDLLQGLDQWIEEQKSNILNDIISLVKIPSISEADKALPGKPFGQACAEVIDEAVKIIRSLGFEEKIWDYYGVSAELPGLEPGFGFFAHLDVVPPGEGWTSPPFEPVLKDGWLIGRGAGDNKGPCITVLYTLKFLKEKKIKLKHQWFCYLGVNEERGMADIDWFLKKSQAPVLAIVTDSAFPVCHGEKGKINAEFVFSLAGGNLCSLEGGIVPNMVADNAVIILSGLDAGELTKALPDEFEVEAMEDLVKVKASGIAAHAARPENSVNALQKIASALLKTNLVSGTSIPILSFITESFADFYGQGLGVAGEDISGKTTHILGLARTEEGQLRLVTDIRYCVTSSKDVLFSLLKDRAASGGASLENLKDSPSFLVSAEDPLVKELCQISNDVLGRNDPPFIMGGGTYARKLPRALGYGLGQRDEAETYGKAHEANEGLRLQNIYDAIKIYVRAVLFLDEGKG